MPACFVVAWLWICTPAEAHHTSFSYLYIEINGAKVHGQWDLAVRDLEVAIGLDSNDDGAVTWNELNAKQKALFDFGRTNLALRVNGKPLPMRFTGLQVSHHLDGAFGVLMIEADLPSAPNTLDLHYQAFFSLDPGHRGLLQLKGPGQTKEKPLTALFSPDRPEHHLQLDVPSQTDFLLQFARSGVHHIWTGYDHILFLLALLLPGMMLLDKGQWTVHDRFRPAFWKIFKIVTAFTLAHSLTLSLAVLELVRLPSRWVETCIALSVALAAANNLRPFFHGRGWLVAFGFGLVHGMGFASGLLDMGLEQGTLVVSVVGFNLGVEAGQMAIVLVFMPAAYFTRRTWLYQTLLVRVGSLAVLVTSLVWVVQRATGH